MSFNFKCCKKKDFGNYICTVCLGIFHPSCLERKSYTVISGNKIHCSTDCATQSEKHEYQISDYLKEIQELKGQIKSKDITLNRQKRLSTDFYSDVHEAQEQYETKIKQLEKTINDLKNEMSTLNNTISTLEQNNNANELKIKHHVTEIKHLEESKRVLATKINAVMEENDKYSQSIEHLQSKQQQCLPFSLDAIEETISKQVMDMSDGIVKSLEAGMQKLSQALKTDILDTLKSTQDQLNKLSSDVSSIRDSNIELVKLLTSHPVSAHSKSDDSKTQKTRPLNIDNDSVITSNALPAPSSIHKNLPEVSSQPLDGTRRENFYKNNAEHYNKSNNEYTNTNYNKYNRMALPQTNHVSSQQQSNNNLNTRSGKQGMICVGPARQNLQVANPAIGSGEKLSFIYLSNLNIDTSPESILEVLDPKYRHLYICTKLRSKFERPRSAAFKLGVPETMKNQYLSKDFWPTGCYVAEFKAKTLSQPSSYSRIFQNRTYSQTLT